MDLIGGGNGNGAKSVSEAMALAKRALEGVSVRIVGEVSELSANPRYKAVYFTIKDKSSALPCMMWNNRYQASGVNLQIGALVEVTGRFSLYAAKGRMSFDVSSVQLAGEGNLRMQVAQLAKRLQSEGLMDPACKRALPTCPMRIGVVTSPRGAAVYDVMRTLRRRFPVADVVVAGVTVEGKVAPSQIVEGLDAMESADVDVVLLVRGGGSFEDLMPFNDEMVARRVASLSVPVVTGIGHEPDTSIADMVSDLRASTPTAAAEAVVPAKSELEATMGAYAARLGAAASRKVHDASIALSRLESSSAMAEPERMLAQGSLALDDLARRLPLAIPSALESNDAALGVCRLKLNAGLQVLLRVREGRLASFGERMLSAGASLARPYASGVSSAAAMLEALSPLAILGRGYAIARDSEGAIVTRARQLSVGDEASVQLREGAIRCKVESLEEFDIALEDIDGC